MAHDTTNLRARKTALALQVIRLYRALPQSGIVPAEKLAASQKENDELIAIFVASVKATKQNRTTR